ncbi:hypothetical protein A2U01_0028892 [Trifolium medium]|uniref:Uncharacterized protein n=1 Tax=Trifolium medium TaxID=97028 RepID=A0A392P6Z2_9FABA|nr:hypothetical protein [Trifolium medium]
MADVEFSSPCTSLSGSFVSMVLHRPFLAIQFRLQTRSPRGNIFQHSLRSSWTGC